MFSRNAFVQCREKATPNVSTQLWRRDCLPLVTATEVDIENGGSGSKRFARHSGIRLRQHGCRRAAEISERHRPHRRAVCARRRGGHCRPDPRRSVVRALGLAGHRRKPHRRGNRDRDQCGCDREPRRPHPAPHRHAVSGQSHAATHPALRHAPRLCRHQHGGRTAGGAGRASIRSGEHASRAGRRRQEERSNPGLWVVRDRRNLSPARRNVCANGRHQAAARSVPGQRRGHRRSPGRQHPAAVRFRLLRQEPGGCRQTEGPGDLEPATAGRDAEHSDVLGGLSRLRVRAACRCCWRRP